MTSANKCLPKFMPGQVIDLSYKGKGLPNRILIVMVFAREQDTAWMYRAFLETTGGYTTLDENFIMNNKIGNSPVYKNGEIIKLYNDGWRFCGNDNKDEALKKASEIATSEHVRNVVLRPAVDYCGNLVADKYGVWVRYNTNITNAGIILRDGESDTIVIK